MVAIQLRSCLKNFEFERLNSFLCGAEEVFLLDPSRKNIKRIISVCSYISEEGEGYGSRRDKVEGVLRIARHYKKKLEDEVTTITVNDILIPLKRFNRVSESSRYYEPSRLSFIADLMTKREEDWEIFGAFFYPSMPQFEFWDGAVRKSSSRSHKKFKETLTRYDASLKGNFQDLKDRISLSNVETLNQCGEDLSGIELDKILKRCRVKDRLPLYSI